MAEAAHHPQPARKVFRWGAIILAMAMAGCQGMVPKTKAPVITAPSPAAAAAGPAQRLPEDQARHRIALLVPLSGANAAVGQSIANAANLALIDTANKTLRITTYDTAAGAAPAAQRALADGNRLFLGPLLAEDVRAIAAQARKANVPVIAFSNDTAAIGDGTYLMGFSPAQSIDRVVRYARTKGVVRFAGLMPTGVYGRNASTALIRSVEAAGGNVVALKSYDRSTQSLSAAVALLGKDQGYDAVLIADSARIAIAASPLIRKASSPQARILGTELWAAENSLARSPFLQGAWYASVSDARYLQLADRYRAQFGKGSFRLASLGYDSVLLTVRIAREWKVGEAFPEARLKDAGGFAGVDGAFRFGKDGVAERTLEVQQLAPTGEVIVAPAPAGFGD